MSRDGRKPWEIPVEYVDSRWVEPTKRTQPAARDLPSYSPRDEEPEERTAEDIEELLSRPNRDTTGSDRTYECTDDSPINYSVGPHDREFGCRDTDDRLPGTFVPGRVEEGDPGNVDYDDEELEPADHDDHFEPTEGPE